jgi:hypothetical protein
MKPSEIILGLIVVIQAVALAWPKISGSQTSSGSVALSPEVKAYIDSRAPASSADQCEFNGLLKRYTEFQKALSALELYRKNKAEFYHKQETLGQNMKDSRDRFTAAIQKARTSEMMKIKGDLMKLCGRNK